MTRGSWLAALLVVSSLGCGDDGDGSPDGALQCTTDSQCDDGVYCNGTERCLPGEGANPLGCVSGVRPCEGIGACIETEDRCDGDCESPDGDGDGVDRLECGGGDCDDEDANRFPGNPEICDAEGVDEDCDPATTGARDRDRDGYLDDGCTLDGTGLDCNDLDASISPASSEVCNGVDDDCDGDVDEGVSVEGFVDADADGRGDAERPMRACPGSVRFSLYGDDCDDSDPSVQPTQNEICDGLDNDCDEATDEDASAVLWYEDADGDGYGALYGERRISCDPIDGFSLLPTDCDDSLDTVSPVGVEACNARDDDCNGSADFAVGGDGEDDDRDGVADVSCGGTDCNDRRAEIAEGSAELCNGQDDDCDSRVDEGVDATDWYVDGDGDGYGAGPAMSLCVDSSVLVARAGDCDDAQPTVFPTARERCDGLDQDCDGTTDEGATASCTLPNARAVCSAGRCEVSECVGVFGDCNLRSVDGCETPLTSMASCGLCGAACDVACSGGFCSAIPSEITISLTVLDYNGTTPIAGADLYLPLMRPLRTFTADAMGMVNVAMPIPTWIAVTEPTLQPILYPYDGGTVPPIPGFSDVGGELHTVEASELTDIGITQDPSLGMIVVSDSNGGIGPQVDASLSLPFGEKIAVRRNPRLERTGDATLGLGNPILLFTNVVPGRAEVDVLPCRIDDSNIRVYPGTLSVARASCF
ncbi:MAG: putative metal-binding motif-containing protein [Deltaproteobacteria bacterium]|nr:putative metal-binding motif-containing protein [Deltaproteobacteria bacterium]